MIFDEMGVPKQGHDSAGDDPLQGVARQYCGRLGKVDNCQVGVFSGYATPKGYALLDKRLFMPEQWFYLVSHCSKYVSSSKHCRCKVNVPIKLPVGAIH